MSKNSKIASARARSVVTVGLLVPGLALGLGLGAATGRASGSEGRAAVTVVEGLRDLQPSQTDALDGAKASLTIVEREESTYFALRLQNIERTDSTSVLGAHLHVGPCVAGNGVAAGAHYNDEAIHGDTTPSVSRDTEVWLEFRANAGGAAHALVTVPFTVVPGVRSVVVHALPTASDGTAGTRLACIPVVL
ncbi:MAG: hypothetical protein ACR2HA_12220 [Nocardioides sp.]